MRAGRFLGAALVWCAAALAGAGTLAAQSGPANCSIVSQNIFVRDVLTDLYYWYQHLPDLDPVDFDSPAAYLDAVRYRPQDSSFSYIAPREADEAFFGESQYIGFGFSWRVAGDGARVTQVFPDGPASEAGLARGSRFLEINGRSIAQLEASGDIANVFGPNEAGVQARIVFEDRAGVSRRATIAKRVVTIPTVSLTRVYEADGRRVGYIFFRNFVTPSSAALDDAFGALREAGAEELILDLRYNGGGLVSVAQHLADLIGAARTTGEVFAEYFHNDKNAFRNHTLRFAETSRALGPPRLIVIATGASASASELIVNALRPFIPVVLVGATTFGKPVGQYGIEFCDKVLAPVSFTLRNARGEGDYFGGFAPDCPADDDVAHDLGDPNEASLAAALTVARTGSCGTPAAAPARTPDRLRPRLTGWEQLIGAF
jgi:C-terminal processing protease CtpA/Prc